MHKILRITRLKLLFSLFIVISAFSYSQRSEDIKPNHTVLGFISDTQKPLFFEKWFVSGNKNEEATSAIFSNIIKEKGLKALFHLGDITSIGSFESSWKEIDKQLVKFRQNNIPVYPAMGNHDYYFYKSPAIEQFIKRFPEIKSSWYSISIDSIAVVVLNSNYYRLSSGQINSQRDWYSHRLNELQSNPAIKTIIVGLHHSPYTNSTVVDPSTDVQNDFVPQFLNTKKCKLFISGHAHAFEHFRNGGKDFLVIGGGGGLQHPLLLGNDQRFVDLFPSHTQIRRFHYLLCEMNNDILTATVIMLNPDFTTFEKVYELRINIKN